jgi:hypothetical protein
MRLKKSVQAEKLFLFYYNAKEDITRVNRTCKKHQILHEMNLLLPKVSLSLISFK